MKHGLRPDHFDWNEIHEAKALAMADDGMGWEDIAVEVGCSPGAARSRVEVLRRSRRVHRAQSQVHERVTAAALADRLARSEARDRRDTTAELFGDPPPGFSALEGKTGQTDAGDIGPRAFVQGGKW